MSSGRDRWEEKGHKVRWSSLSDWWSILSRRRFKPAHRAGYGRRPRVVSHPPTPPPGLPIVRVRVSASTSGGGGLQIEL